MKMVIAGGRDLEESPELRRDIVKALILYNIHEVVSGCASGADSFGLEIAHDHNLKTKLFMPDWKKYGKRAGPIRNRQMAEYTDYVFLCKGGWGTVSMRNEAIKAGKKIVYDNGSFI